VEIRLEMKEQRRQLLPITPQAAAFALSFGIHHPFEGRTETNELNLSGAPFDEGQSAGLSASPTSSADHTRAKKEGEFERAEHSEERRRFHPSWKRGKFATCGSNKRWENAAFFNCTPTPAK